MVEVQTRTGERKLLNLLCNYNDSFNVFITDSDNANAPMDLSIKSEDFGKFYPVASFLISLPGALSRPDPV